MYHNLPTYVLSHKGQLISIFPIINNTAVNIFVNRSFVGLFVHFFTINFQKWEQLYLSYDQIYFQMVYTKWFIFTLSF